MSTLPGLFFFLPESQRGPSSESVMFRELSEAAGSECLGSMTPETQDIYLRMDHHRRRSSYRLGRIIARQQLLTKIARGRSEPRDATADGAERRNSSFRFSLWFGFRIGTESESHPLT